MKTIPSIENFDSSAERHDQRMETWARPEADRFGTWHDWSEEDVDYLLTELAEGHWDDCGEACRGFAMATAGCMIASNANSEGEDGKLRAILDNFAVGLDWM